MARPQLLSTSSLELTSGTTEYHYVYEGTRYDDVIYGSSYDDAIYGYGGNDRMYGGRGYDALFGGDGRDYLYGESGNDDLWGNAGPDRIYGGSGHDNLYGGGGSDRLIGGQGLDNLYGDSGNDYLSGGANSDYLYGGYGADRFVFTDADVNNQDAWNDYVDDFYHSDGDIIDVSGIDAVDGGADNAFRFIGSNEFSGVAGQLRYEKTGDATFVEVDLDGDRHFDYFVEFNGSFDLSASDFIL